MTTTLPLTETPSAGSDASLGKVWLRMAERFKPQQAVTVATPPPVPVTSERKSLPSVVPPERQLQNNPEAQDQLTQLLSQTYASQQTYGDKAQMMEYRDQMFQLVLGEYSLTQIQKAFVEHVKRSPNLPTPHDIASIIDPSLEPLSQAMYIRISEKIKDGSSWVTDAEREYMRRYEARELSKVKTN